MNEKIDDSIGWIKAAGWLVLAMVVHLAGLIALPPVPLSTGEPEKFSEIDVSLIEEAPQPEDGLEQETSPAEPETEPEPEEPEPVKPPPKPKAVKAPIEPPTPDEPPAAAEETPVSFDNVVLTNEGDSPTGWEVAAGSGEEREGPVGNPNAAVTGRSREGKPGGVIGGTGTGVVEAGDLSRQPRPPSLRRKLERLYPPKARAEGREGSAVVRLQVNSDGSTSNLRLISESVPGYDFGDACLRALRGERWNPPLDKEGRPVATRVNFRCGFTIRY